MEFPYQVVVFFDRKPAIGEPIYEGPNGWFPQLAVKRRFASADEVGMLAAVRSIAGSTPIFTLHFGAVAQPEHMPVEVILVEQSSELVELHTTLFNTLGPSKFPGREGNTFFPHMTISWKGRRVVSPSEYSHSAQTISDLWVVKDEGNDTLALKSFPLRGARDY